MPLEYRLCPLPNVAPAVAPWTRDNAYRHAIVMGNNGTLVNRSVSRQALSAFDHVVVEAPTEWCRTGASRVLLYAHGGLNAEDESVERIQVMAPYFLANGISCILDDAIFPDRPAVGLGGWKRHVGPGLLPVVLLPGLEVVLERNAERAGNRRLSDEEVARIHGRMAGWYGSGLPIIDNSQLDVPTTARVLDDVLARAIASPPKW